LGFGVWGLGFGVNEKKVIALEEDNKRLREDMARLRGTLEDRLRAIENLQMARK
jgi:hypothetical protein